MLLDNVEVDLLAALRVGAVGCLSEGVSPTELNDAIHLVRSARWPLLRTQ
jgi:DNA-binding NarL/FixJ family response regulator